MSSADDLLLTSIEAKILKRNIESVGTSVLEHFHEIRSRLDGIGGVLGEHSELLGNMFNKIDSIEAHVGVPKTYANGNVAKHHPPGTVERPSVPPAFEGQRGIVATSTGRFRVDDQFLASVTARLDASDARAKKADEEAAIAKGVAAEIQKAKEGLEKTVGLVWKIGGGLGALAAGCYGLWTWLAHHVH